MAFVKASWGGRGEVLKNYPASAGDSRHSGSIPGSGSFHREANGNPLQYSCWRVPWTEQPSGLHTVHGVTKSWTQLSDWAHTAYVNSVQFSSVQSLSHVRLFATPWIAAYQASLSITNSRSSLKLMSIESVIPAISSSVVPFSSCLQSLPASESFPVSQLFAEVAKVLEFQLQHHSLQRNPRADLQNGLVGSPCSPRDSQESPPTPQFKSINSLVLSFLHSPTLTSIHDHRKNHSLD